MKKWEDIVKDKLEAYESPLPEGSLEAFLARGKKVSAAPAPKRVLLPWLLMPAVAAGLAAWFIFRPGPSKAPAPQDISPMNAVALVTDSTPPAIPVQAPPPVPGTAKPKAFRPVIAVQTREDGHVNDSGEETTVPEIPEKQGQDTPEEAVAVIPAIPVSSPFVPRAIVRKPHVIKVGPAAGIVVGSGLLAALAASSVKSSTSAHNAVGPFDSPNGSIDFPFLPGDALTGYSHRFPVRGGVSLEIPVSERLSITSGLDYSFYSSTFTYAQAGTKEQAVHYLDVPLRLDWTIASNRWLRVYAGSGAVASFCVGATWAGNPTNRDGVQFSLTGAGGIQFNLSRHVGLYVEPALSWTVPSGRQVLQTWRSDHPLMFSLAGGLRIRLRNP